jgi:hypothetical protein
VSKACRNELACFILVVTSYRRARRRGIKSNPPDINICEQQIISQLMVSDQLGFDCSNSSTKSRGYLMPELVTVVFGA